MPCPLRGSGDTEQAGEHPSRWSPVRTRQAGVSRGKQGGLLEEEGGQEQAGRRGPGGASSEPRLGFPGRTRTLVIVAEAHTGPQSAQHGAHTHTCLRDPTITCGHTRHGLRLSGKAKSHSWAGSQDRRGSSGSEPHRLSHGCPGGRLSHARGRSKEAQPGHCAHPSSWIPPTRASLSHPHAQPCAQHAVGQHSHKATLPPRGRSQIRRASWVQRSLGGHPQPQFPLL